MAASAFGSGFSADHDAHDLKKAMKGLGTDEDALISILAHRSKEQLFHIQESYVNIFGSPLVKDLESETSGNFKKALVGLATPVNKYKAQVLHHAMAGAGTDERVLIDVLTQASNHELNEIKYFYELLYGKGDKKKTADREALRKGYGKSKLEKAVASETSFHFKETLLHVLKAEREEGHEDHHQAEEDAKTLYKAGEGRLGTDEDKFIKIFTKRSVAHLQLVKKEYKDHHKHDLVDAIKHEVSGDFKEALLALITPPEEYCAQRLHRAIEGAGTNDSQLVYHLVAHEKDFLQRVARQYHRMFSKTLEEDIIGDTSGDYCKLLVELLK